MVIDCPGYSQEFDPTTLFRTLLVPIDFTPESRRALITACELRARFGSDIHVFLVRGAGGHSWAAANNPPSRSAIEQSARDQLRYLGESICEGMPCLINDILFGDDVVHGIANAARACEATMVILAVHPERSMFWRTRAEKIEHALDIPVMVLKGTRQAPTRRAAETAPAVE